MKIDIANMMRYKQVCACLYIYFKKMTTPFEKMILVREKISFAFQYLYLMVLPSWLIKLLGVSGGPKNLLNF